MATNEFKGFIDGKDFIYDIDPSALNLSVQFSLRYDDGSLPEGSEIISADGEKNISQVIQQLSYDFSTPPVPPPSVTRYTRGLERIGTRLNEDAVLAMVGDSTTDGLGFATDNEGTNGLNSRFYASATLNWTPTNWKGFFTPISSSAPFESGGYGSHVYAVNNRPFSVGNPGNNANVLSDIGGGHQFKGCPMFYWAYNSSGTETDRAFLTGYSMDATDNTSPSSTLYDYTDVFKESGGDYQVFLNSGEEIEMKFCHLRSQELTNGNPYKQLSIDAGAAVINDITIDMTTGSNDFQWASESIVYDNVAAPTGDVAYAWHTATGTLGTIDKADIASNNARVFNGPSLSIKPGSSGAWDTAGNTVGGLLIPVGTMVRRTGVSSGLTIVDLGISGGRSSDHASTWVSGTPSEFGYTDDALAAIFDEAQIDTIMITIGINDTTASGGYTPAEHKAYVQGIIDRYRAQHVASGVARDFRAIINIPPTWRPESNKRAMMESYREPILQLADENEDVCVLDMQLWWYDTYGPYANYGFGAPSADQQLLQTVDGLTDGTHPNPIGGQNFVQQVWKYLSTGADDETPGPYVPPPAEPELLASMVKTEDSTPALSLISGGWFTQQPDPDGPGCYVITTSEGVTPQVASSSKFYPRLIPVSGQLVAQIAWGSGGNRDQFVANNGDDMYVKITINNNGSTYVATSKSIAELNALYGDPSAPGYTSGLDPQRADSETLLRVPIESTEWVGGVPTPDSSAGYGANLGWDVNMGVTIEILSPAGGN